MKLEDLFAESDQAEETRLSPALGSRRGGTPPGSRAKGRIVSESINWPGIGSQRGLNVLVSAGTTLLGLMVRLKNTENHPDADGLLGQVIDEINAFERNASESGGRAEEVRIARYILCTALDDVVLNTPWGRGWRQRSLLTTFHGETAGGEKFFLILDKLLQNPLENRRLLELMYLCLALGFQGRYRLAEAGFYRLEQLREGLFNSLSKLGRDAGEGERELSPHWQGVVDKRNPLLRYVPLWVVAAVGGLLLMSIYTAFTIRLNWVSDPVFSDLQRIGRQVPPSPPTKQPIPAIPKPSEPAPIAKPTYVPQIPIPEKPLPVGLREFLEPEIRNRLVEVVEGSEGRTIRLIGDQVFRSGSASLNPVYRSLLTRIASALGGESGRVLVTGHTDSIPIRTMRFPSNWHLSQARAEAVRGFLATITGNPGRFSAEGRADSEPLGPNVTETGRARNRRVEIILLR